MKDTRKNTSFSPCWWYVGLACLWIPSVFANGTTNPDATKPALRITNHNAAGLGDDLNVKIDHWDQIQLDPKEWVLFFDGVPVKGIHPENADFQDGELRFHLYRDSGDESSKKTWEILHRNVTFEQPVSVTIGPETGAIQTISPLKNFRLIVIPKRPFVFLIVGLVFLLAALFVAAAKSDLLRDRDATPPAPQRLPYSLGRTQMAFWFVLILASYVYIGIINWDFLDTIPASALALMGISAATAVTASLIDQSKVAQAANLRAEQSLLQTRVTALPGLIAAAVAPAEQQALRDELAAKQARLVAVNALVGELPNLSYSSQGFLTDLISDGDGASLHRFQMVAWTVVLGAVFGIGVVYNLKMPEFGATLLALMGISAGTYLGFKFPETKSN